LRLAGFLGKTRQELLRDTDSEELTDWLAYEREYGLGDGFFVAGVLAPVLAAQFAKKPLTAADFVPYFAPPREPEPAKRLTTDQMLGRFRGVSDRLKGRV
jgi:hypothetical protein